MIYEKSEESKPQKIMGGLPSPIFLQDALLKNSILKGFFKIQKCPQKLEFSVIELPNVFFEFWW